MRCIKRITFIWVLVLITAVPYGVYYLLFHAPRGEYALLITLILFWIFGFWAVVGPIVSAMKVRQLLKTLENTQSREKMQRLLQSADSRDAIIEMIASENKIPKFLARKLYQLALKKFA